MGRVYNKTWFSETVCSVYCSYAHGYLTQSNLLFFFPPNPGVSKSSTDLVISLFKDTWLVSLQRFIRVSFCVRSNIWVMLWLLFTENYYRNKWKLCMSMSSFIFSSHIKAMTLSFCSWLADCGEARPWVPDQSRLVARPLPLLPSHSLTQVLLLLILDQPLPSCLQSVQTVPTHPHAPVCHYCSLVSEHGILERGWRWLK